MITRKGERLRSTSDLTWIIASGICFAVENRSQRTNRGASLEGSGRLFSAGKNFSFRQRVQRIKNERRRRERA